MTSRDPLQAASLSRRRLLVLSAGLAAAPAWPRGAAAAPDPADGAVAPAGEVEIHGMSGFGDLKYPADFRHFDYVNPNAPKGGAFSETVTNRQYNQNFLTFNSLNVFILRGDGARAMEATFATLMAAAEDEPDSLYGLAARKVRISADGLTYRFFIRPEARFHDGTKLTARDVAFSLNLLKDKGHPIITQQMRDVAGAEAQDDEIVTVRFAPNRARDVPLFVAGLPIFSRAYYTAHDFDQTTLDIPLGSGAYRVGRFEAGRYIEYQRVADWWGAKLPVSVGQYNFDTLRYEYYRDRDVAFEGFKAKSYLFHEEFTSRTWATGYDFPAIRDGRVKRREIPDDTPSGGQGWLFNTRRPKFANPRLREALNYAFDFEWTNKTIMYGAYLRTHSVFQNSDMMAQGLPSPEELKLLEPWRGKVPDQVFGEPIVPPVSDGSGQDRALLRKASQMLQDAGFPIKDRKRMGANGEPITFEFLIDEPSFQPHHMPFIKNLATLGIDATLAHRRSRAVQCPRQRLRFRRGYQPDELLDHTGRIAADLFFVAGSGDQGVAELCRYRRPCGRRPHRQDYRGQNSQRTRHCGPRARSGAARRAILDSALVQGLAPYRLLGCVRLSRHDAALRPRYAGNVVV